jgi:hypothetical protein
MTKRRNGIIRYKEHKCPNCRIIFKRPRWKKQVACSKKCALEIRNSNKDTAINNFTGGKKRGRKVKEKQGGEKHQETIFAAEGEEGQVL